MTLTLEVRGAQASALGPSARHQFGRSGGVIGRGGTCDWVLPHAKVSARHAVISFEDGVFYVEDKSTNGVFVNQRRERLVRGRPHPLQAGDTLFIDPYDIRVSISGGAEFAGAAGPDWEVDPFAPPQEPSGRGTNPFANPFASAAPRGEGVRPDLGASGEASSNRELDPLKLIGGAAPAPPPSPPRPNATDLEAAPAIAAHYAPPAVRAKSPPPPAPAIEIPEDYNPLADSGATPIVRRVAPEPAVSGPAAEPPQVEEPPPPPPTPPPPPPEPPPAEAPPEATAEDTSNEVAVSDVPPAVVPEAAPPSAPVSPAPTPPPVSAAPREAKTSLNLAAVLAGAGLENVEVTEDLARDFGRILQVVVSGVMDVLRARQQIKDEFRMRMTQFRPSDNNPLKFSANVDDALHNLLVKRNAAYLQPVEAFEDAFDDVRGHQLAMLAGMRVAFEAMLAEFNPDRLQDQFDRQLKKGALVSVPAKLRYWELYRAYSETLLKDTEATFKKLFGQAFADAYEEQLSRLRAERRGRRRDD